MEEYEEWWLTISSEKHRARPQIDLDNRALCESYIWAAINERAGVAAGMLRAVVAQGVIGDPRVVGDRSLSPELLLAEMQASMRGF